MRSVGEDIGVPRWLRPAVDGYVALGAIGLVLTAVHVANALASEFFSPSAAVGAYYGVDGLATWLALKLATYGLIGVGATAVYAHYTDVDLSVALPTRADARLATGLSGVAAGTAGAALLVSHLVGYDLPWLLGRGFGRAVAVRGLGNPAPDAFVLGVVVATRALVVAPALAVVVHGIVQSTLEETAGPVSGVGGAVLVVAVTVVPLSPAGSQSATIAVSVVAAGLVAVVAMAAGIAHQRTGSLALPAATYALFVLALEASWISSMLV